MNFLLILVMTFSINVQPQTCFAPCDVVVTIRIPQDDNHRYLLITLESNEGYSRYSKISLDEYNAGGMQLRYPALPEDNYVLQVTLMQNKDNKLVPAKQITSNIIVK